MKLRVKRGDEVEAGKKGSGLQRKGWRRGKRRRWS